MRGWGQRAKHGTGEEDVILERRVWQVAGGRRAWQVAEGRGRGQKGVTRCHTGPHCSGAFFLAGSSFSCREHNTVATFQSSNVSVEDVFDASKKARNDINRSYL